VEVNYQNFDKDEQQRKLEVLMQQRRERVEKWRQQHNKKIQINESPVDQIQNGDNGEEIKKTWTLEDENDDEEEDNTQQMDLELDDEQNDSSKPPPPIRPLDNEEENIEIIDKKKPEKEPKPEGL
jgi:ATP-dependent RNA helicase DDX46/PRP5